MGKNSQETIFQKLAVFDFDDTLVDCELGEFICRIDRDSRDKAINIIIPKEINDIYENWNWPFRMNATFKYLKSNYDISSVEILSQVAKIKISDSFKELVRLLKLNAFKLVIISDCNSLFIGSILFKIASIKCIIFCIDLCKSKIYHQSGHPARSIKYYFG